MSFMLPGPLRRLQVYAQREEIASRLFNGREGSVGLQASVPTKELLAHYGGIPEVILMGRANVGKSTMINQVSKRKGMANAGQKPGGTQYLNFYRLRKSKLNPRTPELMLVDAPGYGNRGRPEWGRLFDYYIRNRTELRRVFVIINAEHGVTEHDKTMLEMLESASESADFSLQAILSKCDNVPRPLLSQVIAHRQRAISECAPSCLPAIATSGGPRGTFGINEVRNSILEACGYIPALSSPWTQNS